MHSNIQHLEAVNADLCERLMKTSAYVERLRAEVAELSRENWRLKERGSFTIDARGLVRLFPNPQYKTEVMS